MKGMSKITAKEVYNTLFILEDLNDVKRSCVVQGLVMTAGYTEWYRN